MRIITMILSLLLALLCAPSSAAAPVEKITLHIHTGEALGGEGIDPATVSYHAQRITDLSILKKNDWRTFEKRTPDHPGKMGSPVVLKTGRNGVATYRLDPGFYLISQMSGDTPRMVEPILVPVPGKDQGRGDTHVYPKKRSVEIRSTINDEYVASGGAITLTVEGDIPPIPKGRSLQGYAFTFDTTSGIGMDYERTVLRIGDHTLSSEDSIHSSPREGVSAIRLSPTGIAQVGNIIASTPDAKISATIPGKVSYVDGSPVERIESRLYTDTLPGTPEAPSPMDSKTDVELQLGGFTVHLIDDGSKAPIQGSTFEVYHCAEGTPDIVSGKRGEKITVDGVSQWTTDEQGTFTIAGVQRDDYRNGSRVEDTFDYCVQEVASPAGYPSLTLPVSFDLSTTDHADIHIAKNPQDSFSASALSPVLLSIALLVLCGLSAAGIVLMIRRSS